MPADHETLAREYLTMQLGADAPAQLHEVARFNGCPLEGEGPMTVYSFRATPGGNPESDYYVVAGRTQPNYYPAWGLSPDEIYSLHLGTRFMLVMQPAPIAPEQLPASLEADLTRELAAVLPAQAVTDFRAVAGFQVEGETHAIARCRIAGEEVYVLGLDLPLGIYPRTDLPPNVVYRTHLGHVIRMEPNRHIEGI